MQGGCDLASVSMGFAGDRPRPDQSKSSPVSPCSNSRIDRPAPELDEVQDRQEAAATSLSRNCSSSRQKTGARLRLRHALTRSCVSGHQDGRLQLQVARYEQAGHSFAALTRPPTGKALGFSKKVELLGRRARPQPGLTELGGPTAVEALSRSERPWGKTACWQSRRNWPGHRGQRPASLNAPVQSAISTTARTGAAAPGPCCPTGRAARGSGSKNDAAMTEQRWSSRARPCSMRRSGRELSAAARRDGRPASGSLARKRNNSGASSVRPCRPASARCFADAASTSTNACRQHAAKTPGTGAELGAGGTSDQQDQATLLAWRSEAAGPSRKLEQEQRNGPDLAGKPWPCSNARQTG